MIRLFDSASRTVRELRTATPDTVSMYVCGPTVSGRAHAGHGRFALVFDLLRRYLLWTGMNVTYVSNITDIEDKIIDQAVLEGVDCSDITARYEATWWEAMDRLGVMRPDRVPYATGYVDEMVAMIERLVADGAAYAVDGEVFFDCSSLDDYGSLANQSLASLIAGARVEVDENKRSPVDFVLWKPAKPNEPSWPSPWGDGRPGWHSECVVMSLDLLGEGFDLHGGGMDLLFPHHENERAQAVADGKRFAGHWMHNGFVLMTGEKMSKSVGNVIDLLELTEDHDPRAYRMLVLQAHYRSPVDVSDANLAAATAALARLDGAVRRAETEGVDGAAFDASAEEMASFVAAMDNDLDTPAAAALMFEAVTDFHRSLDAGRRDDAVSAIGIVRAAAAAFGLDLGSSVDVPAEVQALAERRAAARAARDFAEGDRLRDELAAQGWSVEDTPTGPVLHRR